MNFPASHLHSIQEFRFFNLAGFNWMFTGSVYAADNNQQIVEGIAARFAQHAGIKLDRVREAFENFQYPAAENNLLLLYTLSNSSNVYTFCTSKRADIYQSLSANEYANF